MERVSLNYSCVCLSDTNPATLLAQQQGREEAMQDPGPSETRAPVAELLGKETRALSIGPRLSVLGYGL